MPATVAVSGGRALAGRVRPPGDKSISHRALLLGALGEGESVVRGRSDGDDVERTLRAVEALGAGVQVTPGGEVRITGGRDRLAAPATELDCGNSGTSMRLLAGLVAPFPWRTVLSGDPSLSARPMDRVAVPLRAMGAEVEGRGERCLPPLAVTGGRLSGVDWAPPMASAQVKSAVLLAGLGATGETVVREAVATRAHTEELLAEAGADISVEPWGRGRVVRLRASRLRPLDVDVPGDPSQAAFWVVAACVVPGSTVTVLQVYGGPDRSGFVGVLARMGADVAAMEGDGGSVDLTAAHAPLQATVVEAAEIPSLDEVPILAVAAALAEGTTLFRGVGELRVKESDRLAAVVAMLEAFGGQARAKGDDLVVEGVRALHPARYDCGGDHRMAMAAAVAALAAGPGTSVIGGFEAVATSYPGFLTDLATLAGPDALAPGAGNREGAHGRRRAPLIAIDGPAGAGKSTVSRALAERLGLERLDTGAMYRAVAWAALQRGLDLADEAAVADIARTAAIAVGETVSVDGGDVTEAIRSPEVNRAVSIVAANAEVRRHMVARQRQWATERRGGVVEGRDIGTVVFPAADLKVYLTASPEERARRRAEESSQGVAMRDHLDSTRKASPLAQAEDARVLDTTGRSVEEVVEEVLSWL